MPKSNVKGMTNGAGMELVGLERIERLAKELFGQGNNL
jgi:hypothetical protein